MDILVSADGVLRWNGRTYRCALGHGGVRADKREGDGATPVGRFALRQAYFRPDRLSPPATPLAIMPLDPAMGWCDDPADPAYNRAVTLPHAGRHEKLWREDQLYDVIVVLGYNDAPPVAGRGSAIFLHVARDDYAPTEGCVALRLADLLDILRDCDTGSGLRVSP